MTKFEEELMATAKMIPTSDGNEIKFKTSSALYDYLLISNGEAELYLQQQALPVVPECVAEFIEDCKKEGDCLFAVFADATRVGHDMPDLVYFWLGDEGNNDELFARAWLDGYQVEKPQLFYLKEKNFGYYIANEEMPGIDSPTCMYIENAEKFTQSDIDSMHAESYELVPVEDGE
ncbi:DUF1642 domain-containing protein [Lactococcus lactis]